jgi:hypothetical protein
LQHKAGTGVVCPRHIGARTILFVGGIIPQGDELSLPLVSMRVMKHEVLTGIRHSETWCKLRRLPPTIAEVSPVSTSLLEQLYRELWWLRLGTLEVLSFQFTVYSLESFVSCD